MEKINEVISILATIEMAATPSNVDKMASVYNLLFRLRDKEETAEVDENVPG